MFKKLKNNIFAPFFKKEFSFKDKINFINKNIILSKDERYFDWNASGLAFAPIEKRINSLLPYFANTHSNASSHANFMDEIYLESKEMLKKILKLDSNYALISNFTNASNALKKSQEILGVYCPPSLKNILKEKYKIKDLGICINTSFEHHSNDISWRESLLNTIQIPLNKKLEFDIEILENEIRKLDLKKKDFLKVAAFSTASNVTGLLLPFKEVSSLLSKYDFIKIFDMSASSSHLLVDPKLYDFGIFATHKLLGGVGASSFLVLNKKFYNSSLSPTFGGGGNVEYSNSNNYKFFDDIERREEVGSVNVLNFLKTALCYKLLDEVDFEYIALREKTIREVLLYELSKIPAITIYGANLKYATPSISFNVASVCPYELANILSYNFNVQTRAGCSCAGSYGHKLLNLNIKDYDDLKSNFKKKPGWLRASAHFSTSIDDISNLVEYIKKSVIRLRGG